jgi:hypothetical protein
VVSHHHTNLNLSTKNWTKARYEGNNFFHLIQKKGPCLEGPNGTKNISCCLLFPRARLSEKFPCPLYCESAAERGRRRNLQRMRDACTGASEPSTVSNGSDLGLVALPQANLNVPCSWDRPAVNNFFTISQTLRAMHVLACRCGALGRKRHSCVRVHLFWVQLRSIRWCFISTTINFAKRHVRFVREAGIDIIFDIFLSSPLPLRVC